MASKSHIPVAHKTIFRADYTASLGHIGIYGKAGAELEATGYPRFEVDGHKVSLFDHEKRRSAVLDPAFILYAQDSGDLNLELQSIDDILSKWIKILNISQYQRLGLRKWFIIPTATPFAQLVALFNSRVLRMEEIAEIMPKVDDTYVRCDCSEGNFRFHFKVGPVQKKEMFRQLEFNREHLDPAAAVKDAQKIVEAFPDAGIFLDIDIFQTTGNMKSNELDKFLSGGRDRIIKIANNWADYIFKSGGGI